jgi:phosphoribosylamine--glycine ligase
VRTGDRIEGLAEAKAVPGVTVFCAGVDSDAAGNLITASGRVLSVTGQGATLAIARRQAYEAVSKLHWPGMQFRRDIAEIAANS